MTADRAVCVAAFLGAVVALRFAPFLTHICAVHVFADFDPFAIYFDFLTSIFFV